MDIQVLTSFFICSTCINALLLVLSTLILTLAGELAYRIYSKFFAMSRGRSNVVTYSLFRF